MKRQRQSTERREDKCCKRPYRHKKNINVHCTRDVKASLMKNKYHILATNPNAKKKSLNNSREVFNCAKNIICVLFCSLKRQLSKREIRRE